MKKQKGFTLVELIIVIIILGILAAYAIPKFINMEKAARTATIQGLAGSMQSASAMIHGLAVINGTTGSGTVNMDASGGQPVTVNFGWPTADQAGIGTAMSNVSGTSGLTVTSSPYNAQFSTNCNATYTAPAASGGIPTIGFVTSGC